MKKLFLFLALLLIAGCASQDGIFIVQDNEKLPSDICTDINNTIFISQTGCKHCEQAKPIIQEFDRKLNLNIKYLNLLIQDDRDYMLNHKFTVLNVPVLIHDCKAYVGLKSGEEYKKIFENG